MVLRGEDELAKVLGAGLVAVRRSILDLGNAHDEFGHGPTELAFEQVLLSVTTGGCEDYLQVRAGRLPADAVNPKYDTLYDMRHSRFWSWPAGRTQLVEVYCDGYEDVGIAFVFDSGDSVILVLDDTDLRIVSGNDYRWDLPSQPVKRIVAGR